jgi:HK97 gp10 family phage protein
MANRVRVEGLRDLDAALGQLGKATGRNVMRRAGRAALEPMAEAARRNAPVEDRDLVEAIAVSTRAAGYARRTGRKRNEVEVYMGPGGQGGGKAPPQGSLQEFGTKNHGPQPFMRPAWDAGKDQALDDVKTALGAEIEKAAQRAARKQARLIAKAGG